MEQLTLEQVAANYALKISDGSQFDKGQRLGRDEGFKAGAEWQKEQYNPLIDEVNITIRYLENIGANHYADDLKSKLQLLQD